ncbi:dual specificity protein phosphatase 23-like [Actinia tenebrosa]|uniref:Dual specificity protein phosphatase 23 n=1 Tax=Actinia tenebrosa TaxID=6105 RepID=A0A6P8IH61_ACTTE|nr:dual specificity protein phosphatase 23-like [Actinia tenebrosa]
MSSSLPPRNFSWLEEGKLAGLAYPSSKSDIQYLMSQGIQHLITLTESPLSSTIDIDGFVNLKFSHIPVVDLTPPTLDQIKEFLKIVEQTNSKGEAVAVHCQYGKGRVGTMLACYLVETKRLCAKDAIATVRSKRPGSIETVEQEKVIVKFAEYLKQCE